MLFVETTDFNQYILMQKLSVVLLFLLSFATCLAQPTVIDGSLTSKYITTGVSSLEDRYDTMKFENVRSATAFVLNGKEIINKEVSESAFWLKFEITNSNSTTKNVLEVVQPLLNRADFYYPDNNNQYSVDSAGQRFHFAERKYHQSANFVFDLPLEAGQTKTFFLHIKGNQQLLIPLQILTIDELTNTALSRNVWFGIYCGIILVMVLYNLFIFTSIRDKSSLYYVLHTLFVGLTQASLIGMTYKYFWPDNIWFGNYAIFLFTCLVSIVGVQFLIEFMPIRKLNRQLYNALKCFQLLYVLYIISSLSGLYTQTYRGILLTQMIIAVFILATSIYLYKKGVQEAKYYLIGWSSLMLGILIYVLTVFGVIPYNSFTAYSLLYGSAAEVTLLSFALADKINLYKLEKERSQEKELEAIKENERIIREQNLMLEKKVDERTQELQTVNQDLNKVLKELKDAEGQLVESEKMAALGQLTAGIAHEINNPINFVTSNVAPLKRDIDIIFEMLDTVEAVALQDTPVETKVQTLENYKEEMDFDYLRTEISHLLKGINEGAFRTAEIVKGLRIFSRVDENDLKKADINEGLDSTIILINNMLNNRITLIKDYDDLPPVECYPGKLNQVFLNIISNAIHAINKKHGESMKGIITVRTKLEDNHVYISIIDNGTGMDEATRKKIFEPFFTTKEVGEGTGLGMSIAYNIIKKHNGIIQVNSIPGEGTEFILDLPINHSELIAL
jgi:signal transduction histidine kinase